MIFEQILVGSMDNFSYLIGDESSKEGAIVDPGWEVDKLLAEAKKHDLNIKIILMTHTHYDHLNSLRELVNATDAVVYVHEKEENEVRNIGITNTKTIKDNDKIKVGKIKVKVIHTPGHSPGSVCFLVENKLITGDTLFVENIGRTDLPGGDAGTMTASLKKLKKLKDDIEVYPGHDYGSKKNSTIAHEKKHNFHMRD
ncbi:hypothetical protein CMO94_03655 [Candidatus Woesearchaeota archaeon]|jgi:glyoxylase-like metal-dependent hydrolase (beta-lactamase superfamily II)|nr:hypothetical protein [Candidatus Woesearchaeota archaeon]|tara:strand:- start:8521 stop:9114 length:594 start_codon:yes stop_codon:yes gene_type:complete